MCLTVWRATLSRIGTGQTGKQAVKEISRVENNLLSYPCLYIFKSQFIRLDYTFRYSLGTNLTIYQSLLHFYHTIVVQVLTGM